MAGKNPYFGWNKSAITQKIKEVTKQLDLLTEALKTKSKPQRAKAGEPCPHCLHEGNPVGWKICGSCGGQRLDVG